MNATPTRKEQEILDLIRKSGACTTAKAISLDLGWGDDVGNIHKYLKRMQEKGLIQLVPQRIEVI